MRLAMVAQWLRAAAADPDRRTTARRYALGITVLQVAWVASLLLPPARGCRRFLLLAAAELVVPVWAESRASRPRGTRITSPSATACSRSSCWASRFWRRRVAIQTALAAGGTLLALLPLIVGGLLTVYSMWWMYFDRPVHDLLTNLRKAMLWGYGHYFVFASAAAVGAGLAVAVDQASHHAEISSVAAGFAVAVPVTVFIASLWLLHDRPEHRESRPAGPSRLS